MRMRQESCIVLLVVASCLARTAALLGSTLCGVALMQFDSQLLLRHRTGRDEKYDKQNASEAVSIGFGSTAVPYTDVLKNNGDLVYTTKLTVGGQIIHVIPDTGSFDAVFFGHGCKGCGTAGRLYDASKSKTYSDLHVSTNVNYGSGSLQNEASFDNMKISNSDLEVEQQLFWMTVDAHMEAASASYFSGIMGLGPPVSAVTFARTAYEDGKRYDSTNDTKELQAALTIIENNLQMLTKLRIQSFSVCLKKHAGESGYLIWNDIISPDHNDVFQEVKVSGKYWSTSMANVKLLGDESGYLGCGDVACSAILDSGTSLLAVPTEFLNHVSELVYNRTEAEGCDDLTGLPDLQFMLDGKMFKLPPSTYIGKITGNPSPHLERFMPHLRGFAAKMNTFRTNDNATEYCAALLMDMGSFEQNTFILGTPFFRHYYTNFELADDLINGKRMRIATNDDSTGECQPVGQSAVRYETRPETEIMPLKIDASKIRPPRSMRCSVSKSCL